MLVSGGTLRCEPLRQARWSNPCGKILQSQLTRTTRPTHPHTLPVAPLSHHDSERPCITTKRRFSRVLRQITPPVPLKFIFDLDLSSTANRPLHHRGERK